MIDNTVLTVSGFFKQDTNDTAAGNTVITVPPLCAGGRKLSANGSLRRSVKTEKHFGVHF